MRLVTAELLRQVSDAALHSPRRRMNHNLHASDESRCHRLLNAVEPATYIRPHRHLDPEKDEAFIIMAGRLGIVTFGEDGSVHETALLGKNGGAMAADICHGTYHTAVSLEPGTVFYEVKAGPYLPLLDEEKAPWAPADDDFAATQYLERLTALFL